MQGRRRNAKRPFVVPARFPDTLIQFQQNRQLLGGQAAHPRRGAAHLIAEYARPHFVAAKYRPKIEGQCALVSGRLAEFVLAQLSGRACARRASGAPELLARATIQTDYGIDLGPAADNLLAVVLFAGGAPE